MEDKKMDIMPKSMAPISVELVTRRDKVVISSDENGEHAVLRTHFEPICLRLWEIAKSHMINNHSDLMLDAVTLSHAKVGDKFLWGWRVTGTTLIKLVKGNTRNSFSAAKIACPLGNWYVIEITKKKNLHASGYVVWTNSKTESHLHEVIVHNSTE